jgi:hypothetical protein
MSLINPSPFDSFQFPELTVVPQEQVEFCIGQFKACILQLVQQNQLPFIHLSTYQQSPPNLYQDLLGVSAMYCQKSPQNQAIIFSMLDHKISSVVSSTNSSSWLTEDYLVRVQALIVYQIIRLFDGDIRLRANAERHFATLEAWTKHLLATGSKLHSDSSSNGYSFERWVLDESVRRTVLMSVMLKAMYSLIKDGFCDSVPLMATLPVSVNGALWNMSKEEWYHASLSSESNLLTYQDFINAWGDGASLYTDVYETILLVACKHNIRKPSLWLV